jgi:hypothetical protein
MKEVAYFGMLSWGGQECEDMKLGGRANKMGQHSAVVAHS